jgi:hypothetical protein
MVWTYVKRNRGIDLANSNASVHCLHLTNGEILEEPFLALLGSLSRLTVYLTDSSCHKLETDSTITAQYEPH